ncbi:MAG: BrnA antitoxin family protein [Desulfocapsaceae bacterium]|nr:BrnA antitoxin family protein [Desulfocapsaceae bacterium]
MTAKKANTPSSWVDPDDAPELTDEFFKNATMTIGDRVVSKDEYREAVKKTLRGRPAGTGAKSTTTIRLDNDILTLFKSTGRGWQTRVNNALREWLKEHKPA